MAQKSDAPVLKFRNYNIKDGKNIEHLGNVAVTTVEQPPEPVIEENDEALVSVAPRKPNWDLRRDVQSKLDKLERKTQEALYKYMQEQLANQEQEQEQA